MPTRKVRDLLAEELCLHPDHDPPTHQFFENGVYEHECPCCGRKLRFTVRHPRCFVEQRDSPWDAFGHQDAKREER